MTSLPCELYEGRLNESRDAPLSRSPCGRPLLTIWLVGWLFGWLALGDLDFTLGDLLFHSEEGTCFVDILRLCSVEWQSDGHCRSERDTTCTGRGLFQHIVLVCPWRCRKLSFTIGNLRDKKLNRKPHNVQQNASHYKRFIDCAGNWGNRNCVGCQPCRVGALAVHVSVRSFS